MADPTDAPAPNAAGLVQQSSSPIDFEGDNRPTFLPPEVTDDKTFREWYDKGGQGTAFTDTSQTAPKLDADGNPVVDPNAPKAEPGKEVSSEKPAKEPSTEETTTEFVPDARTDDEIKASLTEAGGLYADPRYTDAALEFARTGAVTPETLQKTATAFAVSLEVAQSVFDSQRALAEANGKLAQGAQAAGVSAQDAALNSSLSSVVADDAEYAKVLEWGRGSLSEREMASYNKALNAKDGDTAAALLTGFYDRFKASGEGTKPRDITTEGHRAPVAPSGPQGFANDQEMQAAMKDPRYRQDNVEGERYRAGVLSRVKAMK